MEESEKKASYRQEIETLKKKYKKSKAQLAWAEDLCEEGFIQQEMQAYATRIRALNQELSSLNITFENDSTAENSAQP